MSLWGALRRHWFWPFIIFILLYFLMMIWPGDMWRHIESDVKQKVELALDQSGLNRILVDTHSRGREVLLSGRVFSEDEKDLAIEIAKKAVGDKGWDVTRSITWQGDVSPLSPHSLSINIMGEKIIISGVLPSQSQMEDLFASLEEVYSDVTFVNQLVLDEYVTELVSLKDIFQAGRLIEGKYVINGKNIAIDGLVESESIKESIDKGLLQLSFDEFTIKNSLKVEVEVDSQTSDVELIAEKKTPKVIEKDFKEVITLENPKNLLCRQKLDEVLSESKVYFATSLSTLNPDSFEVLGKIINVLDECPDANIVVAGHTDNVGDTNKNLRLSQQRADVVADFLRNQGSLNNSITAIGYGEARPIADNTTATGQSENRRTQFIVRED